LQLTFVRNSPIFGCKCNALAKSHGRGTAAVVIVCVCHNINGRKVREAVEAGASSCAKVYLHHGVRPKCGRCVDAMREMVCSERPEPVPGLEPAFAAAE
jgi:bacterioferritin-associated ferredoxin